MTANQERGFVSLLAGFLHAARAEADIAAYFADGDVPAGLYTGRHFESLAGGGDRSDRAHYFTAEDLVAVQTLSVTVPPESSVQLLEGSLGLTASRYLRDIPTTIGLLDREGAEHLADGAPADMCWRLLVGAAGIGPTTAGKLLARKRPRLIPVYDDVVRCALGRPSNFWMTLHEALLDEADLVDRLTQLGAHAPRHVSPLRLLDVVVWMAHRKKHALGCTTERSGGEANR